MNKILIDMFLKTNRNWSLKIISNYSNGFNYQIVYDNGLIVETTLDIYQTIPRNFSDDWLQITYPNGHVKPYRLK